MEDVSREDHKEWVETISEGLSIQIRAAISADGKPRLPGAARHDLLPSTGNRQKFWCAEKRRIEALDRDERLIFKQEIDEAWDTLFAKIRASVLDGYVKEMVPILVKKRGASAEEIEDILYEAMAKRLEALSKDEDPEDE